MAPAHATILFLLSAGTLAAELPAFRPPAIPLLTTDPFTQTWIRGDTATSQPVSHWDGAEKQMQGLLSIDGVVYNYLGANTTSPTLEQLSVKALPTRTVFMLQLPNVLQLELVFLQSLFADDFLRLSRPVYYIMLNLTSLDGKPHDVSVYLDASAQHTVNTEDQPVQWSHWSSDGLNGVQLGTEAQHVLGSKGDRVNIDWGFLHMAAPLGDASTTLYAGSAATARRAFQANQQLPSTPDPRTPRACNDDMPVLATVHHFGAVSSGAHTVMLAYDDVASVFYFGSEFKGLWTQNYTNISHAIAEAAAEAEQVLLKSQIHDSALLDALNTKAGAEYEALCALAYRQTLAATKLVWNHDRGEVWNFLKEISTNGDMSTMDVIYPGSPLFLYANPELLKLLLIPVLSYAHNDTYIQFTDPYSPHQLGTYPIANDTTERQEPMPLENSGNMMFMLLAIAQRQHDVSWLGPYFKMLASWADELVRTTEFPANQICTDDFTGKLANNTNLGSKGIIALQAFSSLCSLLSDQGVDCAHYSAKASEYVETWQLHAYSETPEPHYKMSFNPVAGVNDSWSIKYNILWQRLLGLDGPFPWDKVVGTELSYYLSKSNEFGIPMDPRHTYVKTDWLSWAAAMTSNDDDFHKIMDPIFKFANQTPSRNPFTDLYDTKSGLQSMGGFIARPVIGGIYAKMLL